MALAPSPVLGATQPAGDSSVEAVARGLLEAEERAAKPAAKASAPQPPTETEPEPDALEAPPAEDAEPVEDEPAEDAEQPEGETGEDTDESALPAYAVPGIDEPVRVDELISGYLRQKDYTQKTMLTANERKAVEQERRQFNTEREQVAARLGPLIQQVTSMLEGEDVQALEELRVTDPGAWSARMVQRQQQLDAVQRLAAQQQALQQQAMAERIPQERAALAAAEPSFAKDFAGTYRATGEYVLSRGFTPAEWNEVTDHRLVLMAHDAMRYRQLTTRKAPEVKKQLAALPKVARPGSPKPAGQVKAEKVRAQRDAALKSGRVEDIAAYLERAHPTH